MIIPGIVQAQTTITLNECIRLAKKNNKKIEASKMQLLASYYERHSARALFFPSISLTGNALYSTSDGSYTNDGGMLPVLGTNGIPTGESAFFPGIDLAYNLGWIYNGGIKMEQPIYMGGKIQAGYQMAKIGNEMAQQNKRLTEAEVIVETSRAYAEVVRTKELIQVATSYHNLLTELMRTVESAQKHGLKPLNDVLKVKVKLNESELNLRRTQNGYRLAMMNLCHYIGTPLTEHIEIDNALPDTSYTYTPESNVYNRPEYQILEQKLRVVREKITIARSEYLPKIGLAGQYGYTNGIELNKQKLFDDWNFQVGIQVSIPIFDFGYRINKIKSAKAQYVQTKAEHENINEQLILEMIQSCNNLDEALLEKELANSSVVSAEENLRTSRLQFEKGVELLSDYLEAQSLWQQARQTQIHARINCYLKWLEYQKATGKIN